MKFAYEELSEDQFEVLTVFLCQRLFGISVHGFAIGPDGGRDAKFTGTAELFPSKAAPWKGTAIIQAKHTNGHNRSFSELDFYSAKSTTTVLGKELPRIKKLRASGELDHYMLFANRKLTGNAEADLQKVISQECSIPIGSVALCGLTHLETWLKTFPDIPALAKLDPVDSPLIVSPDDLAEVVEAFARQKDGISAALDTPPTLRVPYEKKNALNAMTPEYALDQRRRFLKETKQIRTFLSAPENAGILALYESVVDEFQHKIIAYRKDYQTFDRLMEYLVELLFDRDVVLRQQKHKRITRAMVFYMYWNCDIGDSGDVETDKALTS